MKNEVGCVSLWKYARKVKLVGGCSVPSCQDISCVPMVAFGAHNHSRSGADM